MSDLIEVPVKFGPGRVSSAVFYVEARPGPGEAEVAFAGIADFSGVTDGIRRVAGDIATSLKDIGPDKLTVEMGFEVKVESGGLVALLARGGGTATINVTLEWDRVASPAIGRRELTSPADAPDQG